MAFEQPVVASIITYLYQLSLHGVKCELTLYKLVQTNKINFMLFIGTSQSKPCPNVESSDPCTMNYGEEQD